MKIKEMNPGDKGIVVGYEKVNKDLRNKLLSMGLTKRIELEVVKFAPLGDPVEIKLRGFNLTLRKAEADILNLEVCGE